MKFLLCAIGFLLSPPPLAADASPRTQRMEALFDNGRSFSVAERRLALHCLDAPQLMALGDRQRDGLLDRAAAAGFNAVSFEAPLFGRQGLSPTFGKIDAAAARAFTRSLEACDLRRFYAFPVLYPPSGVDGLVGTATARAVFFAGRNAWGWQCWALRQMAALTVKGVSLTQAPVVGGWLLYRGPWPGGAPLRWGMDAHSQVVPVSTAEKSRLSAWAASTVKYARKLGFRQELGLGLWAKDNLPLVAAGTDAPLDAAAADGPPVAALSDASVSPKELQRRSDALDALPAVPGAPAQSVDDSSIIPAAPDSPWDLEGLDWDGVEALFLALPMASQLNFLEFTIDTEDWYSVGIRLGRAADKAEVPVLWRQDWRGAGPYERSKHLIPAAPLAGLEGPWPDDDWPMAGQPLWNSEDVGAPKSAPFRVQSLKVVQDGDTMVLETRLSRPGRLDVQWGRTLPLVHEADADAVGGLERDVVITGIPKGAWFLVKLKVESPRYGVCLLRTRWVRAPA